MTLEEKVDNLVLEVQRQAAVLQRIAVLLEMKDLPSSTIHRPSMSHESPIEEATIPVEELNRETLPILLEYLSCREREILKLRFGIGNGYCYPRDEVKRIFKSSRERVRQIEASAISTLAIRTGSTANQVIDALAKIAKDILQAEFDPDTILKTSISDLHLSHRVRKCLHRLDVQTIGNLTQKSADDLLEVKNFGVRGLQEIRDILASFSLRLRDD